MRCDESFENPGTFFFHRPFYNDFTSRLCALEFGVLKPGGELWIERFNNCADAPANAVKPVAP